MTASLADVLPSVAAVLDVAEGEDRLELRSELGPTRRVVLVLVDGLGFHLLPRLAPHAPLLASVVAGEVGTVRELASPFPSTTPTSLVTLGTGVLSGEHGVVGFTVNVPGTDRVLTHILWRDDPDPAVWQPVRTWYERITAAGVPATVVLPAVFGGSGLTDAAYRGARFCGIRPREDNAARIAAELAAGPGLVYGYTSALDTAAHVHGIASPQWAAAAAQVDALLTRLLEALPADAALLVTADHGGFDVGPNERLDVAAEPQLLDGVRVIAGEPRVRYLHGQPGATADIAAAWRERLRSSATVLTRDEAIADGWFGTVRPEHAPRIGDVVVICHGHGAVLATDREPPEVAKLVGMHGSNSPEETAIPLISLRR